MVKEKMINKKNILGLVSVIIILLGENYFIRINHQLLIPLFFTILTMYWLMNLRDDNGRRGREKED